MKIQELNGDGTPRLDANGNPVIQDVTEETYYNLMDTPIGEKLWRRVRDYVPNEVSKPVAKRSHKTKE